MSGKRQFDYGEAMTAATRLFWAKGYSNTSLRALLGAMKIGEGSFYNTFRSKQHLYRLCLQHYHEQLTTRRWEIFAGEASVRKAIRLFFAAVLDDLDDPKIPNVCMMAASLSSDVLGSRELRSYVLREMKTMQQMLETRLEQAKASGELPAVFDCAVAAQIIVTYLQGFYRVVRVLHDRRRMEQQIETLLRGLGL
ncbi:MAG: TetR/AcrR family transcriptional regulator [Bradyrhizobium sp.]|nr:TetR/AcrR family transcriptional regulator [Bradyrhizobium sp.]